MKSGLKCFVLAVAAFVATSGQAQAALIATDPVPQSVTVIHNGLRWAWASPVARQFTGSNELKVPSFHTGWRYATDQELLSIPALSLFQALAGGSAAAVPYWNTDFTHVDESDYSGGFVRSTPDNSNWESLYVTDSLPEPSSIALLGLGAVGLVLAERRRRRRARDA